MRRSRRQFLLGCSALALAPLLPGCGVQARPLTLAAGGWQGYQSLFVAQRQRRLDPQRVRLVEVPSNASSLRALASGLVDGAALTLDEVLRARAQGVDLVIVLVMDISHGADMLLARGGTGSLAGLRGLRVAVDPETNGILLLAKALDRAGLQPQDVVQVAMPITDQTEAWRRGLIDAAITYDPWASELLARGAWRLFDTARAPDTIVDVLAVRPQALHEQGSDVRHALQAHFASLDLLQRAPLRMAEVMAPHLRLTPLQVLSSFSGLRLPDVPENRQLLGGPAPRLLQAAREVSGFMLRYRLLQQPDTLQQLLSAEFLPEGL